MDVQLSTILLLSGVVAAEIWQQKPPAEWSDKDCLKLMSKSPWAKETTLSGGPTRQPGMGRMEVDPSQGAPGPGEQIGSGLERQGGGGGGGRGGGRGGMGGGEMGGGGGGMPPAMPKANVRWESAAPYQEAMKKMHAEGASAADLEGFYVITVTGLKLGLGGRGGNAPSVEQMARARERMKDQTQLTRKGKDPINCAKVDGTPSPEGTTLRFYFPRSEPIVLEDKDVQFETRMGPMELKTKFAIKEMQWNGKLAI